MAAAGSFAWLLIIQEPIYDKRRSLPLHDKAYGSTEPHYPRKQSIVGDAGEAECIHTSGHCKAVCTTPQCSSRISCQGDI